MRRWEFAAAFVLSSMAAMPAAAQHRTLDVPYSVIWNHAQTGLILSPMLAGLPRGEMADSSTTELDVMVQFGNRSDTWATVYVFRPAGGTLPVWYDRAETQIFKSGEFPGLAPLAAPMPFARPKQAVAGGLRRVFRVDGKMKSTGLAAMPLGDWLVVVRMTSNTLDATALDAKLDAVIAAIGWPDGGVQALAAAVVPSCAAPLAYASKAKLKKPDMSDGLIGALMAGAARGADTDKKDVQPVSWCREGNATSAYGTYRNAAADRTGYLMAMGDAGVTIGVWPAVELQKKDDKAYQLSLNLLDKTLIYPPFDALPRPDKAFEAVTRNRPTSTVTRSGKEVGITLDSGS